MDAVDPLVHVCECGCHRDTHYRSRDDGTFAACLGAFCRCEKYHERAKVAEVSSLRAGRRG